MDLSVVIGFRDWGAKRLKLAVSSVQASFGPLNGEVILVDYGSANPSIASEISELFQLTLVQVTDAPVWSRSRALNAGFALATGDLYISTDADMLFAPNTLETVYRWWRASGKSAMFLQCRDLPESVTIEDLSSQHLDWEYLESVSSLRPRWGVGGMMAISRSAFRQMRGLDERMTTYGREDMDFALRARRMGLRMVWVEDKTARIYHMWHPPTAIALKNDVSATDSVNVNRKIYSSDATISRNRTVWRHSEEGPLPIVSILFSDEFNTNRELIQMLRLQTVSSFEILLPENLAGDLDTSLDSRIRLCHVDDGRLASLIASCRGRYVLPLSGVKFIARDYLEKMLDQLGGMKRLVIAGGAHGSRLESGVPPCDAKRKLRGCMFERDLFAEIVRIFEDEGSPSQESFLSVIEKNGLEYSTANEAHFIEGDVIAHNQDDESFSEGIVESGLFWPFLVANDAEISVRVDGDNIPLLDGVFLDGDLTISTVSIDGKNIKSDSLLRNASVEDLLTLLSYGCKFRRSELKNNVQVEPILGEGWAIEALGRVMENIHWTPHSAIFAEGRLADEADSAMGSDCFTSRIQRKYDGFQEDLTIILTRNQKESDLVFSSLRRSVRLVVLGKTQGVVN
ncbi:MULTISPECIES: glycosyltransferase family 2 protein [unclassified Arthrobacter]|uniref:glycosyltransferase family 2 protein n=1 Tax=unclassified Arthrobacter TaxID=235627 RepID=UPI0015E42538|nr:MULTISPECIES: galactosyltransferase-related protein [unclassified Arthrobacter]